MNETVEQQTETAPGEGASQSSQPSEAAVNRTAEPANPRIVKRYANRKLYDTRDSRYVTLQQIAKYVREGEEVRIIDNRTKEDLTNVTLAQIIYEEEKKADPTAAGSGKTLRNLIQRSSERLITSLRDAPVAKLVRGESEDEGGVRSVVAQSREAWDDFKQQWDLKQHWDQRTQDLRVQWEELQRLADDRVRGLLGNALGHVHQLQGEVKRLQARMEELEERLVKVSKKGRSDGEVGASQPPQAGSDAGDESEKA